MTRNHYESLLQAATPALGYKLVPPPASRAVPDKAAAKQNLLNLARGIPKEVYLELVIERIIQESWPVTVLREEIEKLGVRPQGRTRADLSRQLITLFYDPGRLELVFRGLDKETQAFYAQLLLNLELGPWKSDRDAGLLLRSLSQPITTFTQRIVDVGLAFETGPGQISIPPYLLGNLPTIYVPSELLAAQPPQRVEVSRLAYTAIQIQQFLSFVGTRQMALRPMRQWVPPQDWQRTILRDVVPTPENVRSLSKIRQHESLVVEVLPPEPVLLAADLETFSRTLGLPAALVETLYHLLVALGFLRPGSLVQVEPALLELFVSLDPGEQLTAMARALPGLGIWGPCWQFWRDSHVRMQSHYRYYWDVISYWETAAQTFANLNQVLFQYLALLPHELWLAPDVVAEFLSKFIPKGEVLSPYRLLQFHDGRGSWDGFLRLYLEAMVTGPLHWLGLCDMGRDFGGRLTAFRLHHLQDVVWQREKALSLPPTVWKERERDHWAWKGEQFLLRPPVPGPVMRLLQLWADPAGIEMDWLVYRPSVQRLHTAFESGETSDTLAERWLQSAGAAPPPELLQWWQTWFQRYGHIRLYPNQALLLAEDALTMKEIQLTTAEMREGFLGFVDAKTALLRSGEVDRLLQQLKGRGYMPKELRAPKSQTVTAPADSEAE